MRILIFILILLPFVADAQMKRIYPAKQISRCLDSNGDPIENCLLVSDINGELQMVEFDDLFDLIMSESESAVDSIWVDGDSLRVVFFDSPSIAYYAPGLNGIYSAGNNNKQALVNTIFYPTTGSGVLAFQTPTTGLAKVRFNTNSNTPLELTAQTSEGRTILGLPNAGQQSFISMLGNAETWKFGNNNGAFYMIPRRFMSFPVLSIDAPTSITSNPINQLRLYADTIGTISMSGYTTTRSFSDDPLNFAGWDSDGKLQKYDLQEIIDSVQTSIDSGEIFPTDEWEGRRFYITEYQSKGWYWFDGTRGKWLSDAEYLYVAGTADTIFLDETQDTLLVGMNGLEQFAMFEDAVITNTDVYWYKSSPGITMTLQIQGASTEDIYTVGGGGTGSQNNAATNINIGGLEFLLTGDADGAWIDDLNCNVWFRKYFAPN